MASSASGAAQSGRSLNAFDAMAFAARPSAGGMPSNGASMMFPASSGTANAMHGNNINMGGYGYGNQMRMPGSNVATPPSSYGAAPAPNRMSHSVTNAAAASSKRRLSKSSSEGGGANTGFGFMQEPKKKDAFDFVGDLF